MINWSGSNKKVKISFLLTGNEILGGDITDTNSVYLAKKLAAIGMEVQQKLVVGDHLQSIVQALIRLAEESQIIIINGGLGSTVDDLTSEAVSLVSGRKLTEHSQAVKHIENRFGKKFLAENPGFYKQIKKQAMLPAGVEILDNPVGIAVGYKLRIKKAICYFTPGVPHELYAMVSESILPDIQQRFSVLPALSISRFHLMGIGESHVQELIKKHIPVSVWNDVHLGFRANSPYVELKLAVQDSKALPTLETAEMKVQEILSSYIFSRESLLPETLIGLLLERKKHLVLAESCTGGLICSQITAVAGASRVFEAGYVTYSNRSKTDLLKVSAELIDRFGAVSREVVLEMVKGALNASGADCGIAVTGIAGPSGGSEEKPVGEVYIGWGGRKGVGCRKLLVKRERAAFQHLVGITALDLLRRHLLHLPTDIPYFFDEETRQHFLGKVASGGTG